MRTRRLALEHSACGGFNSVGLDGRIVLAQAACRAAQCAASAYTGHKGVDLAVGVAPYFLGRSTGVGGGVGRIFKLLRYKAARVLLLQFLCALDGSLHALGAWCQHQFGTESLEQVAALQTHGFGHGENEAVALYRCHPRQSDAGIATGRLDNHAAGLQFARLFGVLNHGKCHPVLYATTGVVILELDKQTCLEAEFLFDVRYFEQRRVAHEFSK